ncbi:hypothetical protein ZWY2020_047056 [Hordeum vulgare]|nr:hypothetical protein ZWY2020_047056 [Hordeum vulgare]
MGSDQQGTVRSLVTPERRGSDQQDEGIKGSRWGELNTQPVKTVLHNTTPPLNMASKDNQKDKAAMDAMDKAACSRDGRNISRVLLRGDSSRSQEGKANMRRLGAGDDVVVDPRFSVNLGPRIDDVVELDLTKERDAMKTRWIAVGFLLAPAL